MGGVGVGGHVLDGRGGGGRTCARWEGERGLEEPLHTYIPN